MYTGYIYVIRNTVNNKLYIGQTTKTIHRRFKSHINSANTNADLKRGTGTPLYNAMRKHGVDKFYIEEVEYIQVESQEDFRRLLNEKEIEYIKSYNSLTPNGYNCTIVGEYSSIDFREPVDKYTTSGIFVASYKSIVDAAESLDRYITKSHITECCKGKLKTAYGFVWRYKGEPFNKYNTVWDNCAMVDQYTTDGIFIKTYSSQLEAAANFTTDNKNSSICACCSGINKTAFGYVWRYHGEPFDKHPTHHNKKPSTKIIQLDENHKYVATYDGYYVLTEMFGVHKTTICRKCKNHVLYKGSYWYYEDDDELKQYIAI